MSKTEFIILRVDKDFKKKIVKRAEHLDVNISELVRSLIEDQI